MGLANLLRRLGRTGRSDESHAVAPTIRRDGYQVVRGAISRETCERILHALGTDLGLWVGDPATWRRADAQGIDQVPLWGHQAQWDVRQSPLLHAVWREIWSTERLWVDRNSCRFTLPRPHGTTGAIPIHWDVDPNAHWFQWYPGILTLTDTPPGGGGFCCVPSLYRERTAWPTEWPERQWGGSYLAPVGAHEIVEVPCAPGDLIVFDHRLPHGTVHNDSDHPRVVFYVQFTPAGTTEEAFERVHDHLTGRCSSQWRWKPGHDRIEPSPPARLTPLGRRLLGFDAWPDGEPSR
jgi:hypothetical protein